MAERPLRLGMIGIGVGASFVLHGADRTDAIEIFAGADIDPTSRERFAAHYPEARVYDTADELVAAMDEDGVDVSVALGYGWCDPDVARESNDYLLASAERFPGRIVPFCSVHPRWGRAALAEVERCVEAGAAGIGELHPTSQRIALGRDRALAKLMALAAERGLPVVVHGSEPVDGG